MTHTTNIKAAGAINTNDLHTDANTSNFPIIGTTGQADLIASSLITATTEPRIDSHTAAEGSSDEKSVHGNVARLLNKTVGIEAGERATAAVPQRSLQIVAQEMAARDMQSANDHHHGYQRLKQSMLALSECKKLQVGHV